MRVFVGQEGAWQAFAAPLLTSALLPPAPCAALPGPEEVEPEAASQLVWLLAEQLAAAVAADCSHTSNQLAAALATLAVLCPDWPPDELIPEPIDLAATAPATTNMPAEQQQLALLRLLAALAEAALAWDASMHPQR